MVNHFDYFMLVVAALGITSLLFKPRSSAKTAFCAIAVGIYCISRHLQ